MRISRIFVAAFFVTAFGLEACSLSAPLGSPRSNEPPPAVAQTPEPAEAPDVVTGPECVRSCRARADETYNMCRAQTPGSEANCAMVRDAAYAACPGQCG